MRRAVVLVFEPLYDDDEREWEEFTNQLPEEVVYASDLHEVPDGEAYDVRLLHVGVDGTHFSAVPLSYQRLSQTGRRWWGGRRPDDDPPDEGFPVAGPLP
jgi:hypothetical protein